MKIEIIKGTETPVTKFFSSPSDTPEMDEVEKYSGVTIKDSVTTCGDESSSVYIPVIFARQLERERNNARKDAAQLADRLSGLELRTTEELARMERERDEARAKYDILAVENMLEVNKLCNERDEARAAIPTCEWVAYEDHKKVHDDAAQLADRLFSLELRTTEELAKMEQERNASRELAIAFHNDQTNLILLLQEWKDMAAKLVNIASYALGEFDVKLTLDQQRTITETMREYHSLLKKQ
jgi:hypothetical protein